MLRVNEICTQRELTHAAQVNSRRSIFDIYFGNERNSLGKEQDSSSYTWVRDKIQPKLFCLQILCCAWFFSFLNFHKMSFFSEKEMLPTHILTHIFEHIIFDW